MLNKKEIISIVLVSIILAFAVSLTTNWTIFFYSLLSVLVIILINTTAKKISSFYLESEIEVKLWEIKRYGFKAHKEFKKSFPMGIFLPLLTGAITLAHFPWLASLVFDVKAKIHRAAKRHGLYSFSEMTEYHIGLIATAGITANLVFAILGYFLGLPVEMNFVGLSLLYVFFNMIPISDLDGNKIFFGSIVLWSFLATLSLIGLAYVIFIV